MRVRLTETAQFEGIEAREWYDRNTDGYERFEAAVRGTLRLLRDFPLIGRLEPGTALHWILMPGVPYRVVYRVTNEVLVVGIVHTSREPGSWRER